MENFKNSVADTLNSAMINEGFTQSLEGGMYYCGSKLEQQEGSIYRVFRDICWSHHPEECHWPEELQVEFTPLTSERISTLALSYSKDMYLFPKSIDNVLGGLAEDAHSLMVSFEQVGRIKYMHRQGIAIIEAPTEEKLHVILNGIISMYESNGTIIKLTDAFDDCTDDMFNDNNEF